MNRLALAALLTACTSAPQLTPADRANLILSGADTLRAMCHAAPPGSLPPEADAICHVFMPSDGVESGDSGPTLEQGIGPHDGQGVMSLGGTGGR